MPQGAKCSVAPAPTSQLAGELQQIRAEVVALRVVTPSGVAGDPEVGDLKVVIGIAGCARIVDVHGKPDLAGIPEHHVPVLVEVAGTTGDVERDGDGAVTVVDDLAVLAVAAEDLGEGAAGVQIGPHNRAVRALLVVRERRGAAQVEYKTSGYVDVLLDGCAVAAEEVGNDIVELALVQRLSRCWCADADSARDG